MVLLQDLLDFRLIDSIKVAIIARHFIIVHHYLLLHLLDSQLVNSIILLDSNNFHYSHRLCFQHFQVIKHLLSLLKHLNLALRLKPINAILILPLLLVFLQRYDDQYFLFIPVHLNILLDWCYYHSLQEYVPESP